MEHSIKISARGKTNHALETRAAAIDWDGLADEVKLKLAILRAVWSASECECDATIHAAAVRDLYFPCIEALAQFCAAVEVVEDGEES